MLPRKGVVRSQLEKTIPASVLWPNQAARVGEAEVRHTKTKGGPPTEGAHGGSGGEISRRRREFERGGPGLGSTPTRPNQAEPRTGQMVGVGIRTPDDWLTESGQISDGGNVGRNIVEHHSGDQESAMVGRDGGEKVGVWVCRALGSAKVSDTEPTELVNCIKDLRTALTS